MYFLFRVFVRLLSTLVAPSQWTHRISGPPLWPWFRWGSGPWRIKVFFSGPAKRSVHYSIMVEESLTESLIQRLLSVCHILTSTLVKGSKLVIKMNLTVLFQNYTLFVKNIITPFLYRSASWIPALIG